MQRCDHGIQLAWPHVRNRLDPIDPTTSIESGLPALDNFASHSGNVPKSAMCPVADTDQRIAGFKAMKAACAALSVKLWPLVFSLGFLPE